MSKETGNLQHYGFLEECTEFRVQGWAATTEGGAEVTIKVDGRTVVTVKPTQRRSDVAKHGLAEHSGFSYTFSPPLPPGSRVAVTFEDGTHLKGSPRQIGRNGFLEQVSTSKVQGWAGTIKNGAEVTIKVDGRIVATVKPIQKRSDVAKHGFAERSGFTHVFFPALQPGSEVGVTFDDGGHLHGSPRRV